MPILKVYADRIIGLATTKKLKMVGKLLTYDDPRRIWIVSSADLQQEDVAFVEVLVKYDDFKQGNFTRVCTRIGEILRDDLGKSVEVVIPAEGPMEPQAWLPTKQGTQVYKD